MKRFFLAVLVVVIAAVGALLVSPMSPIPGGALMGEVVEEPVTDWSFAAAELFGHLETNGGELRTITVTCIVADGQLYVGCSACGDRTWSQRLAAEPDVRYRVLGKIYEVRAIRVTDAEEMERVWKARAAKNGTQNPGPKPDDFWFFRLVSR